MNGLAACSGIGGLELGLHIALDGYRTVCHVEREAFCAAALVARMEDAALDQAPVWDDIKTFDGRPWRGIVDIVTAGYPCTPFSVAGRRRGTEDPRHLWPHVARIIRECEPGLVFCENVSGHLSLGFREVAGELQGMGYWVAATLLTAAEVGAPHKRERLFFLAKNSERKRCGGGGLLRDSPGVERKIQTEGLRGPLAELADARGSELEEREGGTIAGPFPAPWPPGPADIDGWARVLERRPELAPAVITPIRRVDDEFSSRVDRLMALGNAVVPIQAAVAFVCLGIESGIIEGG